MNPDHIVARVLYRDALMLVLDKPAGLAVHADRRGGETLAGWLDHLRFGLPRRPEIAHRIDRETSGCLVLGRHRQALARLNRLFADGQVEKVYWAVVDGDPASDEGEIAHPLAPRSPNPAQWTMRVDASGQPALTRWRVLGRAPGSAWLELRPVTGRTHQLRVHCAAAGWPIRSDRIYGDAKAGVTGPAGLHLQAHRVTLPLYPRKPPVAVEAPVPRHMAGALGNLGWPGVAPAIS